MTAEESARALAAIADQADELAPQLRFLFPDDMAVGSDEVVAAAIWLSYLNEAAHMVEQSYATADDVDASMRFGCGYPVGPIAQLREVGPDRVAAALDVLAQVSSDPRLQARPILRSGQLDGDGEVVADASDTPNADRIASVGVVGTGTMATGIVEVFARSGYPVIYRARSAEKVEAVRAALTRSIERQVNKQKLTADQGEEILGRITGTTDVADLGSVDLVVEAVAEDLGIKQGLFADLDAACKPGAILATTTSSLSIADIASATNRQADVIGMHFFNPAPIMRLVEVVSTEATDPAVTEAVIDITRAVRKHPVRCGDRAGFIVNFLLFPYLNDCVRAIDARLVQLESFDHALKQWQQLPLGPFALLDVVGLDVSLAIEETITATFGADPYLPAAGLRERVAAGDLGRKTGAGFHSYS